MGFNSFNFILIFMPVLLIFWNLLNRAKKYIWADIFLTAMSLFYYYTFGAAFLLVFAGSMAVNYLLSYLIERFSSSKKIFGIIGVVFNLSLLFYCKYLGFFADNINALLHLDLSVKEILMPIGISFFTFGQISFIVDRAKGEAPHYPFISYALYMSYFPKLIQGPIAFHKEMIDQFNDRSKRRFDADLFARGLMSFIIGLAKKVILADTLALCVDYGFHYTYFLDTLTVIVVMLAYTFQIYLDFSGYCDMAQGVSMMLGFRLPDNFNSPYKAKTAKELWQRWHMTLSRFFVKYVYIPLGGSRKGKVRTVLNVLIVFTLSGLWHGAGWTYICWGLMQGLLVVWDDLGIVGVKDPRDKKSKGNSALSSSEGTDIEGTNKEKTGIEGIGKERTEKELTEIEQTEKRQTKKEQKEKYLLRDKPLITVPAAFTTAMTFIMFVVSLVFFRSQDMTYAMQMFKRLFFWTYPGFLYRTASQLEIAENYVPRQLLSILGVEQGERIVYMATLIILLVVSAFIMTRKNTKEIVESTTFRKRTVIALAIIFVWSFISLSNVSTFIYFQY